MDLDDGELFWLYRQYDKLVRRRLAPSNDCKICGIPLVTMYSPKDTLVLKCFSCGTLITPGLKDIEKIQKIVDEKTCLR